MHLGDPDISLDNLYPAIISCFAVIISGYIAGRLNLISPTESKGINTFVGTFSLPALVFLSMATLDFSVVNWTFLLSICVAKTCVFIAVVVVSLAVSRPINLGKAGIYGIFCTQSNDFALGYPIVAALYMKSHPEYPSYLYLVAPISLVFLNPIGFVFMELEKRRNGCCSGVTGEAPSRGQVALHITRGVLFNPIVLMTLAGILGNFIFHHTLPAVLDGILRVLGSAFSATALFCLGLRMVGQVQNLSGKALVVPGILIAVKSLVLPLVTRECVNLFKAGVNANDTLSLSTFGFLYGTFPTAPGVFVYASQYNLDVDLIAAAMVACTFFSAPFMFVSAKMVSLHVTKDTDYLQDLNKFLFNISIIGIVACVWTAGIFLLGKKWRKMPHCITLCLVLSQLVSCIGGLLWNVLECNHPWQIHLQFIVFTVGVFSTRIWTACLAVCLLLLRWRSLCFVLRMRPVMAVIACVIPAILVAGLGFMAERTFDVKEKVDPNFQYGRTQATIASVMLLLSFLVTVVALILHQRFDSRSSEYRSLLRDDRTEELPRNFLAGGINGDGFVPSSGSEDAGAVVPLHDKFTVCQGGDCRLKREINESACCLQDVEDMCFNSEDDSITPLTQSSMDHLCSTKYGCSTSQRQRCSSVVKQYQSLAESEEVTLLGEDWVSSRPQDYQLLRHVVLLLLLLVSMLVGFALCMWKLIMEEASGIYVELEFLDVALNFGQGFFAFAVFGLDGKLIVSPFLKRWRKFRYGTEDIVLPKLGALPAETIKICQQFMKYHYEKCVKDLVRDRRWNSRLYQSVFGGNQLVDWLLLVGLVHDRSEAVHYGRHLLDGRIIRHVKNQHHFLDMPYFYILVAMEVQQSTEE